MTRYEQGFLTKCAEYGIDGRELLYKQAGFAQFAGRVLERGGKALSRAGAQLPEKINKFTSKLDPRITKNLSAAGSSIKNIGLGAVNNFRSAGRFGRDLLSNGQAGDAARTLLKNRVHGFGSNISDFGKKVKSTFNNGRQFGKDLFSEGQTGDAARTLLKQRASAAGAFAKKYYDPRTLRGARNAAVTGFAAKGAIDAFRGGE